MIDFFTCLFAELSPGKTTFSLLSFEFNVDVYFLLQYDALKTLPKLSDFITTPPPPPWMADIFPGSYHWCVISEWVSWSQPGGDPGRDSVIFSCWKNHSPEDLMAGTYVQKWRFPKIGGFPPNHPFLIGFSIIFTIHFGGPPLFLETPQMEVCLVFHGYVLSFHGWWL